MTSKAEILSQDEVDALMKGVTGETDAPEAQVEATTGVRNYNIATQERIVRGRMPTLEMINERFARQLRLGLFNFLRRGAEITVGPVRVIKYGEFVRNLVVPTNLNMVQVKPLRGTALFIFDPNFIFLIIDNLFGSDGRYHVRVEGRDFTQTEQRIIRRMLDIVFEEYEKAWAPVHAVKFEYVRSELNTQFAAIATPNEVVVAYTFNIELANGGGELHICLPYSMIEPIRDVLYSALQGDQMNGDNRWVKLMSRQVQAAEVEIVATLGNSSVTLQQILSLKTGDVIPIGIRDTIFAKVDGVPVLECKYGLSNSHYALKVERLLTTSQETITNVNGGRHA